MSEQGRSQEGFNSVGIGYWLMAATFPVNLLGVLIVIPRFRVLFQQMELNLPLMTVTLLSTGVQAGLVAGAVLVILGFVLALACGRPVAARLLSAVSVLLAVALIGYAVTALVLPMIKLTSVMRPMPGPTTGP